MACARLFEWLVPVCSNGLCPSIRMACARLFEWLVPICCVYAEEVSLFGYSCLLVNDHQTISVPSPRICHMKYSAKQTPRPFFLALWFGGSLVRWLVGSVAR
ncbi:hypothetical protein E2P81_ATG09228 [Venturia nashicola]|nr:hypothetical protein E2P81_ATG09228 [Venturia nashicola]